MKLSGFTLIELIVALAVASLAVSLVPVGFSKLSDAVSYRSAVHEILAGLKAARVLAIREGRSVAFSLDVESASYRVEGGRSGTLPGGLDLGMIVGRSADGSQSGRIVFYPDGSSTGGSVSIGRQAGNGTRLRVDWLLGKVSHEPL